jgi:hypothetical protein
VPAGWSERFEAMLKHGTDKGWYDASAEAVKGHIEWLAAEEDRGGEYPT